MWQAGRQINPRMINVTLKREKATSHLVKGFGDLRSDPMDNVNSVVNVANDTKYAFVISTAQ